VQHPLAGEEACCLDVLFPYLADLHVDKVEDLKNAVLITARSCAADAVCHRCGLSSARVNSRYRRRLHDLAAGGRAVMIDLEVRRFFCGNPDCELRTFAEQVPAAQQRCPALMPLCHGGQDVDDLAMLIDRPVEIGPLACNLQVGRHRRTTGRQERAGTAGQPR
jgi:hypothetical protein